AEVGCSGQGSAGAQQEQEHGEVAEEGIDDDDVTERPQDMQRNPDTSCGLLVREHEGLQLEHQQQDDPGRGVDAGRERLDDVAETETVREPVPDGRPFLREKYVHVDHQQRVHGVLEVMKQFEAIGGQYETTLLVNLCRNPKELCNNRRILPVKARTGYRSAVFKAAEEFV